MPSIGTPLRAPPRSNARPQFASTPRFLLSQRTPAHDSESHNRNTTCSQEVSNSSPISTTRVKRGNTITRRPRRQETIEDSSSEDQDEGLYQPLNNQDRAINIPNSSPDDVCQLDIEFDALFDSQTSRKRRRVSAEHQAAPSTHEKYPRYDSIISSSLEPSPPTEAPNTPSPSILYRTPDHPRHVASQRTTTPQPLTPITADTSIRRGPRFAAASFNRYSGSQSQKPRARPLPTATPKPTSTSPKRRPAFVLPRSPSPSQFDDASNIPTPFSPSSKALHRRGRLRSTAPAYLPDGLASQVRSWILETGSKREQLSLSRSAASPISTRPDTQSYSLIVRVTDVRQTALESCGPMAFVYGQAISSLDNEYKHPLDDDSNDDDFKRKRNVLLLGAPRLRHGELRPRVPDLAKGDLIGICRGLVWELNSSDGQYKGVSGSKNDYDSVLRKESQHTPGRWLVGMEWDVVS